MSPMDVNELVASRQLPRPELRRALRLEAELTLEDIASRCDVTRSAVSRWERGLRDPKGSNRVEYSKLLAGLRDVLRDV